MNTAPHVSQQFRGTITDVSSCESPAAPRRDDLDLVAMAKAGLNYLRGNPEPGRACECKFSLGPLGIPCHLPELVPPNQYGYDPVSLGDTDCRMDWQYTHMREMAGEPESEAIERGVHARVLGYLRDDHYAWINPAAYIGQPIEGLWIGSWTTAKLLYSLAEAWQRNGDRRAKEEARSIFLALKRLAVWDGDRPYYRGIAPFKDGEWLLTGWCQTHGRNYPFVVEACVRYWECTGDEEALAFARAFTEGFLAGVQPAMDTLRIDPQTGAFEGHVHMHTHAIWGVAHLGALLGEKRYLDWARLAYEFVLSRGTDYGWYPEFIPQDEYRTEICVVGDMVSLATWLARAGQPHYWEHIERTLRNHLRRAQFVLTPAFCDLFQRLHADKPRAELDAALGELRRLEGGFVAQATFNDWVSYPATLGAAGLYKNGIQMMGCCPPEGMRALWEAWSGAVEALPDGVRVNMHITRDHPAARVTAYEAAAGRVDVEARAPGTYYLRPPVWAEPAAVELVHNGRAEMVDWGGPAGAYAVCRRVSAKDQLTLRWPALRFTQTFKAASIPSRDQTIVVNWIGNQVMSVQPHGQYLPMFGGEAG